MISQGHLFFSSKTAKQKTYGKGREPNAAKATPPLLRAAQASSSTLGSGHGWQFDATHAKRWPRSLSETLAFRAETA